MTDTRPAIRWINYMSGREEMERTNLIGPFASISDRNSELARLEDLPLGNRAFNGGQQFFHATMAEAVGQRVWDYEVVEPAQVAQATTQRGFHAAYAGYDDEPEEGDDDWVEPVVDPYELHPDQTALFRCPAWLASAPAVSDAAPQTSAGCATSRSPRTYASARTTPDRRRTQPSTAGRSTWCSNASTSSGGNS